MPAAPGPSPLLAQRGDRAGEADRDRAVELADVDPELERVGGRDAEQLALHQPPLDLPALRGRVPGAVGREPGGSRGVDPVGGEAVDQLRRLAALREADRAQPARDERRPCSSEASESELARTPSSGSSSGGFQSTTSRSCVRRGVDVDDRRRAAGERERELARVRDRGRREQELRLGAVDAREPPQPPQHVADVRAEDAAVDVRLVDDHEAEVVKRVAPAVVVREDADVEHVGVRQDDVRGPADLRPPLRLGVAVVDRRAQAGEPEARRGCAPGPG